MARIVHVGNFSMRMKGAAQHSVAPKLSNGLIRNGHSVVNFSDRDVARASSIFGRRRFGAAKAGQILREFCRDATPDLLLLGHADVIAPEVLEAIRADRPAIRMVQWNVDPLFEPDNVRRIESKIDVVDATLISTAGPDLQALWRPGRTLGFLPNPVDFSVESGQNHLKRDLPYDLFYVCGNPARPLREICGRAWNMEDFMRHLLAALPTIRPLLGGLLGRPHLAGAAYQTALESAALGLNLSRRNDVPLYSSDRLAHMIGNGQAVLMERATGYDALFGDDEIAFYSSLDELIALIGQLVADPDRRQRLATQGRARYHALFNEQIVARYIVDVAFERLDPAAYPWPTLARPA